MHLLVRETHGLDEGEAAVDLGQSPGDVVFLSFSDSDLRAMRAASPAPLEGEGRGEGHDPMFGRGVSSLPRPLAQGQGRRKDAHCYKFSHS